MTANTEVIQDALFVGDINVASYQMSTNTAIIQTPTPPGLPSDVFQDYDFSRTNLYDIMKQGYLALERMTNIADQTQNSKDYRVVGELITALSTANEKLLDIHKKKKELQDQADDIKPKTTNIDKAVFMTLTTAELLELTSNTGTPNNP